MRCVVQLLDRGPPSQARDRIPILWSDERRERLRRTATREVAPDHPVDLVLAQPLLMCAEGRFIEAERDILNLLREYMSACERDNGIFTGFVFALFAAQRFDLIAAMLRDIYGFSGTFELGVQHGSPGHDRVKWDILASGDHNFTLDAAAYQNDATRIAILLFQWIFPLCSHYAGQQERQSGSLIINLGDIGAVPGLAFCDSRPDRFLVPDTVFIPTKGHSHIREGYQASNTSWTDRRPVAFWRGTTTGIQLPPGNWRSLERIKLCELAARPQCADFIDAGISNVVQFDDPAVMREIKRAGLIRDFVPWQEWNKYKYHIDIDGNTNAWSGFFSRLLSGSPVLKVESSRGLVQWYYDRLVPWNNYVPVAPDLSDLVDKVKWMARNDSIAERIGQRGRELADSMTYDSELRRAVPVISAAFRYLGGQTDCIGPYGRDSGEARDPVNDTFQANPATLGNAKD